MTDMNRDEHAAADCDADACPADGHQYTGTTDGDRHGGTKTDGDDFARPIAYRGW